MEEVQDFCAVAPPPVVDGVYESRPGHVWIAGVTIKEEVQCPADRVVVEEGVGDG